MKVCVRFVLLLLDNYDNYTIIMQLVKKYWLSSNTRPRTIFPASPTSLWDTSAMPIKYRALYINKGIKDLGRWPIQHKSQKNKIQSLT